MQNNAAEASFDNSPAHEGNASDGPLRDHGKKGRLHLPGSKSARKVAGIAANKATKGATRMASALSKKVHHAMDGGSRLGGNDVPPELFGAAGDEEEPLADGPMDPYDEPVLEGEEEEAPVAPAASAARPQAGGAAAAAARGGVFAAAAPPEVQQHGPPRPERKEQQRRLAAAEAPAAGPRRAGAGLLPGLQAAKQATQAAAKAAGVRPLQCRSIWEIPTSRFPEPERPAPAPKARASALEEKVVATPAPHNIRDTTQQAANTLHDLAAGDVQTCERVWRILLAVLAALLISGFAGGLAYLVQ